MPIVVDTQVIFPLENWDRRIKLEWVEISTLFTKFTVMEEIWKEGLLGKLDFIKHLLNIKYSNNMKIRDIGPIIPYIGILFLLFCSDLRDRNNPFDREKFDNSNSLYDPFLGVVFWTFSSLITTGFIILIYKYI